MLLDHVGEALDVLISLLEEVHQSLVLLLVNELPVAFLILCLHRHKETILKNIH